MDCLGGYLVVWSRVVIVPECDAGGARLVPIEVVRGRLGDAAVHELALVTERGVLTGGSCARAVIHCVIDGEKMCSASPTRSFGPPPCSARPPRHRGRLHRYHE